MGRTGDGSAGRPRAVAVLVAVLTVAALAVAALAGCGDGGGGDDGGAGGSGGGGGGSGGSAGDGDELRRELLAMQAEDQAERTGGSDSWNDAERTERLAEIIDEHGWPGRDLVGEDGASAAWLIAQHSDLDVEFQERALELMREAVDEGQADPSELAYLEDRVALNRGRPQTYGTQIGCVDGRAEPAELADPDGVDERRAEAGLPPLADYLAELAPDCAAEAAAQPDPAA